MNLSAYDMYKVLSIVGGVPWYLEQFHSTLTADDNIKQPAFEKNGLLVHEFDRIFHDLFNNKGIIYKKKDGSDGGFHHFSTGSGGGGGGQRALCAGIIISEPISYRRS